MVYDTRDSEKEILSALAQNGMDPEIIKMMKQSGALQDVWRHPVTNKLYNGREAAVQRKLYSEQQKTGSSVAREAPVHITADPLYWLAKIITQDPTMIRQKKKALVLSRLNDPVLIEGETGTGKELFARALHGTRKGDFVAINCGGFPEHLFESEMFGHEKGAFTGAERQKMGLIEQANEGTLFIDEISNLPIFMQNKLLRFLQLKTIRPVGSNCERHVTCRVIAATNTQLHDNPDFKQDLLWRINTATLCTVPLQDRKDDIPLIAASLGYLEQIDPAGYWPGNVRQLQQVIRSLQIQDLVEAEPELPV